MSSGWSAHTFAQYNITQASGVKKYAFSCMVAGERATYNFHIKGKTISYKSVAPLITMQVVKQWCKLLHSSWSLFKRKKHIS